MADMASQDENPTPELPPELPPEPPEGLAAREKPEKTEA